MIIDKIYATLVTLPPLYKLLTGYHATVFLFSPDKTGG